jgi:hypothetical protein
MLDVAEAQAGAQEFLRIDRLVVDARLVMQMRAGRAELAKRQPDAYLPADLHVDVRYAPLVT